MCREGVSAPVLLCWPFHISIFAVNALRLSILSLPLSYFLLLMLRGDSLLSLPLAAPAVGEENLITPLKPQNFKSQQNYAQKTWELWGLHGIDAVTSLMT